MKFTSKLLAALVVVTAALVLLGVDTATALPDSGDSPLYEATLMRAYSGMNEVRSIPQAAEDKQGVELGGKPTQEQLNTRCPGRKTKCPVDPKYTKCGVTHSPNAPTECRYQATVCEAETWCPEQTTYCPRNPTECPEEHTKCPKVDTRCPIIDTECPEVPEYTTCSVTHEPGAPTECSYAPTVCEAKTWCPEQTTYCPAKSTECPEKETHCPPKMTECPLKGTLCHIWPTKCPPKKTECPPKKTKCPADFRYKKCGVTCKPNGPTQCEYAPTLCKAETWCPTIPGECPPESLRGKDMGDIGMEVHDQGPAISSRRPIEPRALALFESYPNPFSSATNISFMIPSATHVTITIYDVSGSAAATLVDTEKASGLYTVAWDGADMKNGIYFCRMVADGKVFTRKLTLIR
ncbi:MAG: T9SS type A sorting domain-containing protein [bacterium]